MPEEALDINPPISLMVKVTFIMWLAVLAFITSGGIISGQISSIRDCLSLLSGFIFSVCFASVILYSFFLARKTGKLTTLAFIFAGVIVAAILQTAADYAGNYVESEIFSEIMPPHSLKGVITTATVYFSLYLCNAALLWVCFAAERAKRQEVRLTQAGLELAESQLAALRMQLNPHFMCNTIGSVSGLIADGQYETAALTADRLAAFLRDTASALDDTCITLDEELDIIDDYLAVEGVRFGSRLSVSFDCPAELGEALVPSFILQPFAENAIKHAVSRSSTATSIAVIARREESQLLLSVENRGPSVEAPTEPGKEGIGLANTRRRLRLRYGDAAGLRTERTTDGFRAVIWLPMDIPGTSHL